jgi:hypothetical protein
MGSITGTHIVNIWPVREITLIIKISKFGCQIHIWPLREIMLILKI